MGHTLLISGPPGCGKTTWICQRLQAHRGPRAYLRLGGFGDEGQQQARDGGIDAAVLQDRVDLTGGGIDSHVRDLEGERQLQQVVPQRKVIGIGSGLHYTLYDPGSDRIEFRTVDQQPGSRGRGFA